MLAVGAEFDRVFHKAGSDSRVVVSSVVSSCLFVPRVPAPSLFVPAAVAALRVGARCRRENVDLSLRRVASEVAPRDVG